MASTLAPKVIVTAPLDLAEGLINGELLLKGLASESGSRGFIKACCGFTRFRFGWLTGLATD
jgi:hypothetical protein